MKTLQEIPERFRRYVLGEFELDERMIEILLEGIRTGYWYVGNLTKEQQDIVKLYAKY